MAFMYIFTHITKIHCFSKQSFEELNQTRLNQTRLNFLILIHPGDSIYVEFYGKQQNSPDFLKTIKFSGSATQTNQHAAAFQYMFEPYRSYYDGAAKMRAVKNYDLEKFMLYLDTLKLKSKLIFDKFVSEYSPKLIFYFLICTD